MIVKTGEHCGKLAAQNRSPTGKSRVFHHFHRENRGVFHGFNRVFHNFNVDNPFTQWITDWKYTECEHAVNTWAWKCITVKRKVVTIESGLTVTLFFHILVLR